MIDTSQYLQKFITVQLHIPCYALHISFYDHTITYVGNFPELGEELQAMGMNFNPSTDHRGTYESLLHHMMNSVNRVCIKFKV